MCPSLCMHPSEICCPPLEWNLKNEDWFLCQFVWLICPTASTGHCIVKCRWRGMWEGGVSPVVLFVKMGHAVCLLGGKIWIIIHLFHFLEQHLFALYAEISVDLHCVWFLASYHLYGKKGRFYYYYDGWIQFWFSGHQCWIFTSSTSFSVQSGVCLGFFPSCPLGPCTYNKQKLWLVFATVYTGPGETWSHV